MASPVAFLQRLLGEANEAGQTFAVTRSPEYIRKQDVLRRLDETKLAGEELALRKGEQDLEQGVSQLQESKLRLEQNKRAMAALQAGTMAAGEGPEFVGPVRPDVLSDLESKYRFEVPRVDSSQLGLEDAGLAESIAQAARRKEIESRVDRTLGLQQKQAVISRMVPSPVTPEEAQLWSQTLGIDVQPGTPMTPDQRDSLQAAARARSQGGSSMSPTQRYGGIPGVDAQGRLVLLDRLTGQPLSQPGAGGAAPTYRTAPNIPGGITEQFAGMSSSLRVLGSVGDSLEKEIGALGPVGGTLASLSAEYLGGLGLSPEVTKALVDMRRGTITEAFANGGKQLTPTEKVEFFALYPQPTDSLQYALIKWRRAEEFLRQKIEERARSLTPFQREGLDPAYGGNAPAFSPPGAAAAPVLRKRQRNRATGEEREVISTDGGATWQPARR